MPRLGLYPTPQIRFHGGRYRIYWKWNGLQYSVATHYIDPRKKTSVEVDLRLFSAALAMPYPVFPSTYQNDPAVNAYMKARFPKQDVPVNVPIPANSEKWLTDYEREMKSECSDKWVQLSIRRLRKLNGNKDRLVTLTPDAASQYLACIKTKATRNRHLATFSRFYKWAIRTKRTDNNPFFGIKALKEEDFVDIVYCTPAERDEIIAFAKQVAWEDHVAIIIAFYAGMRREEIANLLWKDVRFDNGCIKIRKTKTHAERTFPLNQKLEQYLLSVPEKKRVGFVVKCPTNIDRLIRMETLVKKIKKIKVASLLAEWNIERPMPSRSVEYKVVKKAYDTERRKRKAFIEEAKKRIGWNSFRHTFGSLLAQSGVSIDKISAWMGNSPDVCRKHYTQFMPRDKRDREIDNL